MSTTKLNRLLHHSSGDFTVTVEAGLPLIELQAALAQSKQWLAVDWPWGAGPMEAKAERSVGLSPVAWPVAFASVTGIRDQVIGLEVMRADGTEAKAGGQVVKNVAGYDLMRLFCGSWGSLGLITQITLRTFPNSPTALACSSKESSSLESMRQTCLRADLMPQRLDWRTTEGQPSLLLGLVSISRNAVTAQLEELHSHAMPSDSKRSASMPIHCKSSRAQAVQPGHHSRRNAG